MKQIPRVVRFIDIKQWENTEDGGYDLCILTEYCEGKSLEQEIKRRGLANPPQNWSENQLMCFLLNNVEVFAKAQQMGIAHRDIKPENVLLMANGDFKVGDFGASKGFDAGETFATIIGTPPYLSY